MLKGTRMKTVRQFLSLLALMLMLFVCAIGVNAETESAAQSEAETQVEESSEAEESETVKETETSTETTTQEPDRTQEMLDALNAASLKLANTSYTYTGKAIKPSVSIVSSAGKTISSDYVYTTTYTTKTGNYADAGSYRVTVKVTGFKNAAGETVKFSTAVTKSADYKINPKSISDGSVTLSQDSYIFSYVEKKPTPTVKNAAGTTIASKSTVTNNDGTKKTNTNWTKSYANNYNAGTATITITGTGNYTGKIVKQYTINPTTISNAKAEISATSYTYDGTAKKPGVSSVVKTVVDTDHTLVSGTDYTVSYSSNVTSIGSKTVTITGKGNFTGKLTKTYKIVPEKASGLKTSSRTLTSVTVTCTAAKDTNCAYEWIIRYYDSDKQAWVTDTSKTQSTTTNSATFSDLTSGRHYKVDVRYAKTISDVKYAGAYNGNVLTCPTPAKVTLKAVSKASSSSLKVTWSTVSYADGYQIQYSTKSDFSSASSVLVSGASTSSKTISTGSGNYYVRVRSYRTVGSSNVYGSWSGSMYSYYSNVYASYSTTYRSSNTNRTTNLQTACKAINGTILANGATFNFNNVVGPRTAARGYKEAIVYQGGEEVLGMGGGICQVATTIFNAALRANFTINSRYQHSMTVHYVPLGYDAAISGSAKNLRFTNNSGYPVKIVATCSGGTLTMKFMTNAYVKPPTVSLSVTVTKGSTYKHRYTLKRTVNGKVNYTCYSEYSDD